MADQGRFTCHVFIGASLGGFIARPNGDLEWPTSRGEYGFQGSSTLSTPSRWAAPPPEAGWAWAPTGGRSTAGTWRSSAPGWAPTTTRASPPGDLDADIPLVHQPTKVFGAALVQSAYSADR